MSNYSNNIRTRKKSKKQINKIRVGMSLVAIFSVLLVSIIFNIVPLFNTIFFGVFGLSTYPIIAFVIFLGLMITLEKEIVLEKQDLFFLIIWLIVFASILHLISVSSYIDSDLANAISKTYISKNSVGGIIFTLIVYPINYITYFVASIVLFLIFLVVLSVVLVDRAISYRQLYKLNYKGKTQKQYNDKSGSRHEYDYHNKDVNNRDLLENDIDEKIIDNTKSKQLNNDVVDEDIFISDDYDKYQGIDEDVEVLNTRNERSKAKEMLGLSEKEKELNKNILQKSKNVSEFNYNTAKNSGLNKKDYILTPKNYNEDTKQESVGVSPEKYREFVSTSQNKPPKILHGEYGEKPKDSNIDMKKVLSEADKKNIEYLRATKGNYYKEEQVSSVVNEQQNSNNNSNNFNTNNQHNNDYDYEDEINNSIYDMSLNTKNYDKKLKEYNSNHNNNNNSNNKYNNHNSNSGYDNKNIGNNFNNYDYNHNNNSNSNMNSGFNNSGNANNTNNTFNRGNSNSINNGNIGANAGNNFVNNLSNNYQVTTANNNNNNNSGYSNSNNGNGLISASNYNNSQKAEQPIKIKKPAKYIKPPIDLLKIYESNSDTSNDDYTQKAIMLEETLASFKTPAKVVSITKGPAFTRFELQMPQGIPVKRITSYVDDIAMILEAQGAVRVEIPIPGKNAFGVEVPNEMIETVGLRDIIESYSFQNSKSLLTFALGKDITGDSKVARLNKMPHLLVAGQTGSGKSVCLNSLIISLIYKASPDEVKIILVDPKRVEFTLFNGLPHLLIPNAITEPDKAISAMNWTIDEMERRFNLFAKYRVKNLDEYNMLEQVRNYEIEKLPYLVLIVDELADLMIINKKELEEKIIRIAQKSRAAGIHLVLATQRPSVDVITGIIKANLPSRIAFSVSSFVDSKTILDQAGAEKLLGKGDMLYLPVEMPDASRIQGAYISNEEVEAVVEFVKENNDCEFDSDIEEKMFSKKTYGFDSYGSGGGSDDYDPLMKDALRAVIKTGGVSISKIQRMFSVGFPRAGKIVDQMEKSGFVSEQLDNNTRTIFITQQEFEEKFGEDL